MSQVKDCPLPASYDMEAVGVLAKKEAAIKGSGLVSDHAQGNGGKPWQYLMIPHDMVADNMTLAGLAGLRYL